MGALNGKGDLAAVEIAFYSPALLLGVFVVARHGVAKQLGWLYVVLLSILRLIGASVLLYIETQNDYSAGLLETAAITSAVGTAPLLLALLGFLERLHHGMQQVKGPSAGDNVWPRFWRLLHLVPLVGLILAIIGGVDLFGNPSGSSTANTGKKLLEAGSMIFLAFYLALALITMWMFLHIRHIVAADRKLMYAAIAALPFLLVRILFSVIAAFADSSSPFYFENVNVWVEAFMMFLMEVIVISLFITAGLLTPKQPISASTDHQGRRMADINMETGREQYTMRN